MLAPRIAWGLDIGQATIKAVKLRRTKVGAEVLAFDVIERAAASEEAPDRDYQLQSAISTLVARNRMHRAPVAVSIPEPAFSRFIPLPPVDRRRIPEVVRYEARQQIPFPIEEVVWDYQPVREAREVGEETEVAIFSVRSQFVYALLTNLKLCRVEPVAVLPVPLALYNFLTYDRDIAKGTIVIDLGAGSTDILICDPENFRVRNITVSGNGITRALAERLKISPAEAEQLKRECKDRMQAERLFKLIQPTLNDLVGQVQRTIGFFKSQIHNVRIEQAMLLGNTFRLPGVSDFFVGQLGCDLMAANELERVTLADTVDSAALKEVLPSLGVALGLGLQAIGLGRVQVNLMPRQLLIRQEMAKKRLYAVAGVACLAVMLGANLWSLKAEKDRAAREIKMQQENTELVRQLKEDKKDYDAARDSVVRAVATLEEPAGLSAGFPEKSIGYRGCIAAMNALNQVLEPMGKMGKEVVITRLELKPGTASCKAAEYGGRPGDPDRTVPAVKLELEARVSGVNPVPLFDARLAAPLREAGMGGGGTGRRRFVHVGYEYTVERGGSLTEIQVTRFNLRGDFAVLD